MSIKDQQRLAGITEVGGYGSDDFYGRRGMDDPYGRRSELGNDSQAELARVSRELEIVDAARDLAEKAADAAVQLVLALTKLDAALEAVGRQADATVRQKLEQESEHLGRMLSDLQPVQKNRVDALLAREEKGLKAELKDYGG